METLKLILIALGAPLIIALVAWVFARLVVPRLEALARDARFSAEQLSLLYPAWGWWGPSLALFLWQLAETFKVRSHSLLSYLAVIFLTTVAAYAWYRHLLDAGIEDEVFRARVEKFQNSSQTGILISGSLLVIYVVLILAT